VRLQTRLTLLREAVSVPLARRLLAAILEGAGLTSAVVEDVKVALTEACTNAYQHVDAVDSYEVVMGLDDDYLTLQVIDRVPDSSLHHPRPARASTPRTAAGSSWCMRSPTRPPSTPRATTAAR
jgi:anti-sigma regulatory factor (Ser/Thr protein kinase)